MHGQAHIAGHLLIFLHPDGAGDFRGSLRLGRPLEASRARPPNAGMLGGRPSPCVVSLAKAEIERFDFCLDAFRELAALGPDVVEGAITGRALYEGRLTIAQASEAARRPAASYQEYRL